MDCHSSRNELQCTHLTWEGESKTRSNDGESVHQVPSALTEHTIKKLGSHRLPSALTQHTITRLGSHQLLLNYDQHLGSRRERMRVYEQTRMTLMAPPSWFGRGVAFRSATNELDVICLAFPLIQLQTTSRQQFTAEEELKIKAPIIARFEAEGHPYFSSARWVMSVS